MEFNQFRNITQKFPRQYAKISLCVNSCLQFYRTAITWPPIFSLFAPMIYRPAITWPVILFPPKSAGMAELILSARYIRCHNPKASSSPRVGRSTRTVPSSSSQPAPSSNRGLFFCLRPASYNNNSIPMPFPLGTQCVTFFWFFLFTHLLHTLFLMLVCTYLYSTFPHHFASWTHSFHWPFLLLFST